MTDTTGDGAPIPYPFAPSTSIFHPSQQLRRLREERPVARVVMPDGSPALVVTRYADVRQVLTDARFSRAAATGSDAAGSAASGELGALTSESLIGMDPPEHTRLRRLVARAFTPRRVEQLRPRVAELVGGLVDGMLALPRPVDLIQHFSTPLPVRVISELLGVPEADRHRCKAWSDTMMGDWRRDPAGTQAAFDGFASMIAAKRDDPGDDLITALIAASDGGDRLSERELLAVCVGVLIGGHETTTHLINLCVLTLLEHPGELARLRADLDALPAAVEELARFIQLGDTGVMLPRVATEDLDLGGVRVPAGTAVLAAFVTANRDPAAFPDPDRLDLRRAENLHLGFGAGVHHCLGAQLAKMELQEALRGLLTRLPALQVAVPVADLHFKPGLVVRSLESLPLTW